MSLQMEGLSVRKNELSTPLLAESPPPYTLSVTNPVTIAALPVLQNSPEGQPSNSNAQSNANSILSRLRQTSSHLSILLQKNPDEATEIEEQLSHIQLEGAPNNEIELSLNGFTYKGPTRNGKPHGWGVMTTDFRYKKYEGQFENGMIKGTGTKEWDNGAKCSGEWDHNMMCGEGTSTYSSGSHYVGHFLNDKRNGQGTMRYINGDVFVGTWRNNERHFGVMRYSNWDVYEGEWENDLPHGHGSMKFHPPMLNHKKSDYRGNWKDGKQHGRNELCMDEWYEDGVRTYYFHCGYCICHHCGSSCTIQ